MPRSLPAFLLALSLGFTAFTPSTQAAPSVLESLNDSPTSETNASEKGAWWGFEFIICVATEIGTGEPLVAATSSCRLDVPTAQDERERGDILQAWWGFEF